MRPILALAILLLGLKAAFPEVELGAVAELKLAELKFHDAKFQDRVPAADDDLSSGVETTGSIANSESNQPESNQPESSHAETNQSESSQTESSPPEVTDFVIAPPQRSASETKKSDRVPALSPAAPIEASDAAHDQSEATGEPSPPAPLTTDPDASVIDSIDGLCNAVMASAQDNDLPVPFFANLIWQESRLQRDSVSRAGALGIAQFMPEVAVEVGLADPFDPRQAIPASARFLKVLRQQFGNLGYVAAAYNAGAHRVGDWLDRRRALPQETRTYVLSVTGRSAEAWRKSAPDDAKLGFAPSLPCRRLPAFAELEQAQLKVATQNDDATDTQPQQEKIATHVARLIIRKVASKVAARVAARLAARATAKAVAKVAPQIGNGGSVAHPLVTIVAGSKTAAKPAVMARNFHVRRDALRRPQPVPHEKRRVA
jgi:Transglycosylase SLT domain